MTKHAKATEVVEPSGLGASLRRRRKEMQLTLQSVADKAGLTTGFISQVERDLAAPSLSSLMSIATALQSDVSDFLQPPRSDGETTRGSRREVYTVPGATTRYERLSTKFPGSGLTAVLVHAHPGHRSEPISHDGEEFYYVVSGEITVSVDGRNTVLRQGDSIHFDSGRTHFTWNHTQQPVAFLVCNTMDVFGDDEAKLQQTSKTTKQGERLR